MHGSMRSPFDLFHTHPVGVPVTIYLPLVLLTISCVQGFLVLWGRRCEAVEWAQGAGSALCQFLRGGETSGEGVRVSWDRNGTGPSSSSLSSAPRPCHPCSRVRAHPGTLVLGMGSPSPSTSRGTLGCCMPGPSWGLSWGQAWDGFAPRPAAT